MRKLFASSAMCVPAAFALIAGTLPALAATTAEKATALGLIGTWALGSCDQPPSADNGYYIYETSGPDVVLRRDYGPRGQDHNRVLRIDRVGDLIEVEIHFASTNPPETRTWAYQSDGYRMRVKYNRGEDGSFTVRNFRLLGTGDPTPWNVRCH